MTGLLFSTPWKRGIVFLGALAFLWITALICRIPGTPFSVDDHGLGNASAVELGRLGAPAANSGEEICALAVSRDGALVAAGTRNGQIRLWDGETRSLINCWKPHEKSVSALAFSADAHSLLTAGDDRTIAHWGLEKTDSPRLITRHKTTSHVTALAFAPLFRAIAVAYGDRLAQHDLDTGALLPDSELCIPGAPILALAFAPDGTTLAAGGGGDSAIRIWGLTGGRPVLRHTLVGHEDHWLRSLAYTDDGDTLVSVDTLGRLISWDRLGHRVSQARTGQESCVLVALGGHARLTVAKDVSNRPPLLWQLSENWWR